MAPHRLARNWPLVSLMVAIVAAAAAVVVWDLDRQSLVVVTHVAETQAVLASVLARDLPSAPQRVFSSVNSIDSRVFVKQTATSGLVDEKGRAPSIDRLERLAEGPSATLMLSREESVELGLASRRSVATWALGPQSSSGVLVVTSARIEREQAEREEWVVVSTLVLVTVLSVVLGAIALRREQARRVVEYELEREVLRRERDEQLARAERVAVASALSLGVSHELATPLGVMVARLEQVRRTVTLDPKATQALAVVFDQIEHMRHIMQGFLALARGDAPVLSAHDPERLARDAAALVLHRFNEARVRLEFEFQPTTATVAVDASLMRQALANVLINALHASPQHGAVIFAARPVDDTSIEFSVRDQGSGVPTEVDVTRPLVTTRAHQGGTGLGLAIVTEVVRHHGGTFSLETAPSGGALARIILPLSKATP